MSIHIEITDQARTEYVRTKKRTALCSLAIALLGTSTLGGILYLLKIAFEDTSRPEIIMFSPGVANDTEPAKPVVTPPRRPRSSPSASPARIVATTAPSAIAINIPDIVVSTPQLAMSDGLDLGTGFGPGPGAGGSGFGDTETTSGLVGTFYDLKQTPGGEATGVSPAQAAKLLQEYIAKGWDDKLLRKYYQSPVQLQASHFYIPQCSASEAPKAFRCADRVQPSRWVAVYKGTVTAPVSGMFRFVGAGDDALVVRFNKETVFDFGWYQLTQGQLTAKPEWIATMKGDKSNAEIVRRLEEANVNRPPVEFYPYPTTANWNRNIGGVACGKTFRVEAGKRYPIEILISEIPGGLFGMALFVEQIGAKPASRAENGSPILPLFRTNWGNPESSSAAGEAAPFDKIGPVWETSAPPR